MTTFITYQSFRQYYNNNLHETGQSAIEDVLYEAFWGTVYWKKAWMVCMHMNRQRNVGDILLIEEQKSRNLAFFGVIKAGYTAATRSSSKPMISLLSPLLLLDCYAKTHQLLYRRIRWLGKFFLFCSAQTQFALPWMLYKVCLEIKSSVVHKIITTCFEVVLARKYPSSATKLCEPHGSLVRPPWYSRPSVWVYFMHHINSFPH